MDGDRMDVAWHEVCGVDEIWPDTGICALIDGRQIAVFRLSASETPGEFFAIDNHDPMSGANVLSRGLIGNLGERLVVASPIYKHHYDLRTGECVEDPSVSIHTFGARVRDGRVWVGA